MDNIENYAKLNITYNGQNGDLADPVSFDATDAEIRQWAGEAIGNGSVAGINAVAADFGDFVVDRFRDSKSIFLRPKVPFGASMKVTGWQLREALKMWELRKGTAEKLFPDSLQKFADEDKDPPQDIVDAYAKAELAIARLQVAQMRYNLGVQVMIDGTQMSLADAIKRVGAAGRIEKMWGSVTPKTDRYDVYGASSRDPSQERAVQTLSVKDGAKLAEQASKRASAMRAAINTGNGQEIAVTDLDQSLFE